MLFLYVQGNENFRELNSGATPTARLNSQALADNCTLVTNNLREFERVAGLKLENWAENAGTPPLA